MKKIMLAALLAVGFQAQAQVSYSYIDLGYDYIDLDGGNADGFSLEGSFTLTEQTYLGAFYRNLGELDRYGLMGGYHHGLSDNTDIFVQLELGQVDTRFGDEFSYGLGFGFRTEVTDSFKLNTKFAYTEVEDVFDGFYEVEVQGIYQFTEVFGVTAEVKTLDGDFGAGVGVRFTF